MSHGTNGQLPIRWTRRGADRLWDRHRPRRPAKRRAKLTNNRRKIDTILLRSRSCELLASRKTSASSKSKTAFHFATMSSTRFNESSINIRSSGSMVPEQIPSAETDVGLTDSVLIQAKITRTHHVQWYLESLRHAFGRQRLAHAGRAC